jgi:mannan endo-1,4-beta-mannosidase
MYVGGSGTLKWDTGAGRSGTFYINGGSQGSGTPPGQAYGGGSTYVYFDTDVTLTHDANGNWSGTFGASASYVYGQVGSGSGTWGMTLDRLALAPTMNNPVATNVSVVTATISGSAANNGNGTSTTIYLRYKKTAESDASYVQQLGDTWNLTGLTPATSYTFQIYGHNNNSDASGWVNTQTFTTLPAPSTSAALLDIIGVL